MKKYIIAIAIVVIFASYAIHQHNQAANNNNQQALESIINQTPAADTPPTDTAPVSPASPSPAPAPKPVPSSSAGKFKDGSYTGSMADAFYGNMQVQAIISGGKLTDVKFIQYPNDRGETSQISSHALPLLRSEAIAAQSANVDIVSGATQDSQSFQQSLQSALDQAKI